MRNNEPEVSSESGIRELAAKSCVRDERDWTGLTEQVSQYNAKRPARRENEDGLRSVESVQHPESAAVL